MFEDEGTGTLTRDFGGNPLLSAGANVNSDFELSSAKAVTISPGLAADYFLAAELVELEVPVPIGFSRAGADIGICSGMAETGYVEAVIDEVEAKFFDIDVMLTVHATDGLALLVGYRCLAIDGDGLIDNDTSLADITIDGIVLGGGVRF